MALTCQSCGALASDEARFCASCGNPLSSRCPSCGATVDPGARFCSSCGTALAPAPSTTTAPVTPTEERRVISALFADLVGYTAHTERTDPEDSRRRLTLFHSRVRQDVERFGGRVEKLLGDGVFAAFGSAKAHEDDAERAVRSALRIVESVEELNAEHPHLGLAVRVAVTTGEAIVQLEASPDREGIVGDVVNTASRLQAVAAPGEVVVDERTQRASRDAVNYESRGEVELKGKQNRQPVWQATGLRSRYGVAVEEEPSGAFVGRNDELSLLTDTFDRAVARRSPQLVTIVGEPGVGKSRLVREFRRVIDDRPDLVWWRQGRCLPYGEGVTFWAIGEVVKAQAGVLESEPVETVVQKLRSAVAALFEDADEATWVELRLRSLVGLGDAQAEKTELFAAWLRFFEALAARNPLILVVEDLHWADVAVLDFVTHLLDWAHDSPILILCTARPELFAHQPDWGGGRRDAVTIGLSPLSEEETAALMASLAKRPLMDASLQHALVERSGGNPLYVTEFLRLAEEQGWLDRVRGGEDLPMPDSVSAIIAARLDLLEPGDKAIIQAAAVIGRVFWSGALSFVEDLDPAEVQARLRRLVARELIRPVRRSSMQGQDEYSFAHILARDGAYSRLTREDRARLHEATARWLEAVSGERAIDVAELLAYHHATAFELAPSVDTERRRRVYRFQLAAGDRARAFDANRAARFYQAAVALAANGSEKGRPLLELGILVQGTTDETAALLTEALEAFAESDDRQGQAEAASELGRLAWYQGHAEEADRWQERSLQLAEGLEPSPTLARVVVGAAAAKQLRGEEEEGLELVDRALEIAQKLGDTEVFARGLVIRGTALVQMGDPAGIEDIEEGLRIQLDRNDTTRAMSTYNNLATIQIAAGELARGRKTIEEGIAYGTARGLPAHVDWSQNTRNEALFPLGEWDECLRVAEELIAEDLKRGGSQVGTFSTYWAALVRFFRGETDEPLAMLEGALSSGREIEDPQVLMPGLGGLIICYELAGKSAQAKTLAEEFYRIGPDHPVFVAGLSSWVAPTMTRSGMTAELAELIRVAKPIGLGPKADVDNAKALLAEAHGDLKGAAELLSAVITASDEMS
ncbi:MAG TPA: adenylate/guanylate cyclase domain-containing protein, partial [Acidimicrobiia bacterium]|nr:adenylate/guanylate cyclase domain-containing protein [Acidimicrobiia bacterium]